MRKARVRPRYDSRVAYERNVDPRGRFLSGLSVGIAFAAFAVSAFAAWGTWEQVRVNRDAISEQLNGDVLAQAQQPDGSWSDVAAGSAPPEGSLVRLVAVVSNEGKGRGLVTAVDFGTDSIWLSPDDPHCSDGRAELAQCTLPIVIESGSTKSIAYELSWEFGDGASQAPCSPENTDASEYLVRVMDSSGATTEIRAGSFAPPC